ncbi:hypothetical protein ACSBR2_040226 [Camellia fascicularis]
MNNILESPPFFHPLPIFEGLIHPLPPLATTTATATPPPSPPSLSSPILFTDFHRSSTSSSPVTSVVTDDPPKVHTILPLTPTQLVNSNNGKHPNLILIVGIGAGMLIIAITAVLIICSCSSRRGNKKASAKETDISRVGVWFLWNVCL